MSTSKRGLLIKTLWVLPLCEAADCFGNGKKHSKSPRSIYRHRIPGQSPVTAGAKGGGMKPRRSKRSWLFVHLFSLFGILSAPLPAAPRLPCGHRGGNGDCDEMKAFLFSCSRFAANRHTWSSFYLLSQGPKYHERHRKSSPSLRGIYKCHATKSEPQPRRE